MWVAPTDRSFSPRHIASSALEDSPAFLPDGDLLFRAIEEKSNFLYRMHVDGSGRRKVSPDHILAFNSPSPDGRWAVVEAKDPKVESTFSVIAVPIEGGSPVRLCINFCLRQMGFKPRVHVHKLLTAGRPKYLCVCPSGAAWDFRTCPPTGFSGIEDLKKFNSAVVIPHIVDSVSADPSTSTRFKDTPKPLSHRLQ